ncbi:TPA: hypothetical protein RY338_005079 [Escherichia coli]|uniref:hypothetical protein n=1 Tax=Escherichia coli TaxID=562 RepID=UPI0010BEFE47|nr:hypothetical protein [Escherichia coli]TKD81074.1 hypothetical protein FCU52_25310 [Escherichia coli]HAH2330730.1 hypothetical protein [Escherichia coli]HAN7215128.1 hypothetical protein [Escherichia coli]HEB1038985.1 hypothetical protein [Escherichia coli]
MGSCAAPSAKGDDKFITTDYLQQCPYEYNRNLTLKLSVQNLMNRDYSEALNKLNMMPGLGDETHPANSARGRTWIFGGDIRF